MKKLLLFITFIFACNFAFAEVNTNGLTTAQQAELTIQAEKMKQIGALPPVSTIETVSKWAEAGKGLAVGLGAGAKELGVAVNEFSVSPVGRVTTGIIIWKLVGKDVIRIIVGLALLFLGLPSAWFVYRHMITETVTYEDYKGLFGITRRRINKIVYASGDGYGVTTGAFLVIVGITTAIAINLIAS